METPSKQHDSRYPAGEPTKGKPQTVGYPNTQEITLFKELLPIPQAIMLPDRKIPVTEPNLTPLRAEQPRDGLPHLERFPAIPRFDLETTIVETLVPAMTLRAWERHYGIPVPLRNTNNYRQYSQRDLAAIKWLRWRIKRNDTSVYMAMTELARFEPAYVRQQDGEVLLETLAPHRSVHWTICIIHCYMLSHVWMRSAPVGSYVEPSPHTRQPMYASS
ncbi:MerR family transcriptional regulator [Ktedonospora formicarum]|uniref:HTH merR-type domain-containing protein n=1 Tax=Ktedonospora formicarum TaxID=2778364 RepID=A0A8J3MTP1_9CHLR|nr:MerR family transcriptional regulator [Ktedonospora formicarum]GHO44585.1 hypothetical protein KSX_27480 [Ktedonospora formicarum]